MQDVKMKKVNSESYKQVIDRWSKEAYPEKEEQFAFNSKDIKASEIQDYAFKKNIIVKCRMYEGTIMIFSFSESIESI